MAKTKISEYSSTANSNTDVGGINIDEGCAPSGINDAIRTLMAQLKNFQTGANGDSFNGPIGTTTPAAGTFTTLSSSGNTTLGDASTDTVTVNGYMGVGGAGVSQNALNIISTGLTGSSACRGVNVAPTFQSGATSSGSGVVSAPSTAAASFTMANMYSFAASNGTKGAGSTITNQYGFQCDDLTRGDNIFGFSSAISSGSNKWNIYASGTADNYFAGNVGVGTTSPAKQLDLAASNTGITTGDPLNTLRFTDTDTTSAAGQPMGRIEWYSSDADTAGVKAYIQAQSTDGSPDADMVFATNHVSGGGTAEKMRIQYDGSVGVNTTTIPSKFSVVPTSTSTNAGAWADSAIAVNNSTVLNEVSQIGFGTFAGSATKSAAYIGFQNKSATSFGYGDLIFGTRSVTTDTAPTERMRIDSSGNVLVTSSGGLGYGTGSGGTVTQATSRTTGVTLNKTNGAITLVSAAGSTTIASFTVTNSTVAATDTIHICQKSGTDLYRIYVTNVAAGSFKVSFATLSGTTTEQPVFNFAVIKSVTS